MGSMRKKIWEYDTIGDSVVRAGDDIAVKIEDSSRTIIIGNVAHIYAGDHGTAPAFAAYAISFKGGGQVHIDEIEDIIVNPKLPDDRPSLLNGGPNRWRRLVDYQEDDDDE